VSNSPSIADRQRFGPVCGTEDDLDGALEQIVEGRGLASDAMLESGAFEQLKREKRAAFEP
jgi:hypothetical protein